MLQGAKVEFDLVGPTKGTRNRKLDGPPGFDDPSGYLYPDFDQEHASRSGLRIDEVPMGELLANHKPELVFIALGVNDLLQGATPEEAIGRMKLLAREAAAGGATQVVLMAPTQVWLPAVAHYNALLGAYTREAGIALVGAPEEYSSVTHTWDTIHPNSLGEQAIACAVARTWVELDLLEAQNLTYCR